MIILRSWNVELSLYRNSKQKLKTIIFSQKYFWNLDQPQMIALKLKK